MKRLKGLLPYRVFIQLWDRDERGEWFVHPPENGVRYYPRWLRRFCNHGFTMCPECIDSWSWDWLVPAPEKK